MASYWHSEVLVDGHCKCSTGGATLSEAIEKALRDAVYYQAIYPTSRVVIAGLSEACAKCHNEGTVIVRRARSSKVVKCPTCRGKLPAGKCGNIALEMPDAANRIRIVQDVA